MRILIIFIFISLYITGSGQDVTFEYEPNNSIPFGEINPEAPSQLADYAPMIGICDCKSVSRLNQQTWADTVAMKWRFKYIMNGTAVQDETLKEDGTYSGSIRQYNADSMRWYVHYYSSSGSSGPLATWEGGKKNDDIILYREQKAPNGMDGYYKITFSDISEEGFNWLGEWVSLDESFHHPTWKIFCKKRRE